MYKRNLIQLKFSSNIAESWFSLYLSLSSIHCAWSTWWQTFWLYQIYWQMRLHLLSDEWKWDSDICNAMSHQNIDIDKWWSKSESDCQAKWNILKQSDKNNCQIQNLMIPVKHFWLNACCSRNNNESIFNNLIQCELIVWLNAILFHSVCSWLKQ